MLVEEATTSLEGSLDIVGFAFGGSSSATISSSCSDISCAVSTGFEGFLSATTALGPGRPEATCFLGGARAFELGGRADPLYKTSSSYLILGRHVRSILSITTHIPYITACSHLLPPISLARD